MIGIEQRMVDIKEKHPELGFLIRTDEQDGFFIHIHGEAIIGPSGGIVGFNGSWQYRGPDVVAGWDDCMARMIKDRVQ